jgi:hypothetical protein
MATKAEGTAPTAITAGDLLFVKPAAGDWVSRMVADGTNGPYSHVCIVISAYEVIQALPRGISRGFYDPAAIDAADVARTGHTLNPQRQTHAIATLVKLIGHGYGWLDDL